MASKNTPTKSPEALLLSAKSPFSVREAYKTLRMNVTFSLPGTGCKCIGITSANRSEGKSTIATNLSLALAQINKKVVLIDCDMRLPTIAAKLSLKAKEGLSNYLSGAVDEIPIIHVEERGIDVISSGNIPPDSTTLIDSALMKELIVKLKEMYDYVIFDFPPVNLVSDAVLMSEMIDGYLIVIRHHVSEYKKIAETVRQLQFADAKIIGFVYNGNAGEKRYYKKSKYYYNKYYYYGSHSGGSDS